MAYWPNQNPVAFTICKHMQGKQKVQGATRELLGCRDQ